MTFAMPHPSRFFSFITIIENSKSGFTALLLSAITHKNYKNLTRGLLVAQRLCGGQLRLLVLYALRVKYNKYG